MATLTLPGLAAVQDQPAEKPKQETQLRIQVTGAQPAVPVKGAAVYLEWSEGEETRTQEGTTNAEGIAGPYKVARVKVFVQVTTSDDSWERYGGDHELQEEQQTVSVNLRRKAPSGLDATWRPSEATAACRGVMPRGAKRCRSIWRPSEAMAACRGVMAVWAI